MNPATDQLIEIIDKIAQRNPIHAKKLRKNLSADHTYSKAGNAFLEKYVNFLKSINQDIDFGIDCYLKFCADMLYEHIRFLGSATYSSTSFDEVNARVYNNPEVMEYHMHGLLLSQILWIHHYRTNSFFSAKISQFRPQTKRYLEIGGGFGLTMSEALKVLGPDTSFHLLDISETSLNMARKFINNAKVNYILKDVFQFTPEHLFDFITMGEVLEHVEDPSALLKKLNSLLRPSGYAYITAPANAPTIDHIYLFKNADDIRQIIKDAGFMIIDEIITYAEDVSPEKAEKLKVTLMYGAFIQKPDQKAK